jgi:hypothetical protein
LQFVQKLDRLLTHPVSSLARNALFSKDLPLRRRGKTLEFLGRGSLCRQDPRVKKKPVPAKAGIIVFHKKNKPFLAQELVLAKARNDTSGELAEQLRRRKRTHINHKSILHIPFDCAFIGFFDVLDGDEFDI